MIFIDTTVLVAGIDASDTLHEDGKAVLRAILDGSLPGAVTTDYVLDETLTLLRRRGASTAAAAGAVEGLLSSSLIDMVFVHETLFKEALTTFRKYQKLSFTDAVSLTVMQRQKIKEVFSHDRDFDLKGITRKERP